MTRATSNYDPGSSGKARQHPHQSNKRKFEGWSSDARLSASRSKIRRLLADRGSPQDETPLDGLASQQLGQYSKDPHKTNSSISALPEHLTPGPCHLSAETSLLTNQCSNLKSISVNLPRQRGRPKKSGVKDTLFDSRCSLMFKQGSAML